jgi:DNA-binding GntR family transcriptional regulator
MTVSRSYGLLGFSDPESLPEAIASEIIKQIYAGELRPGENVRLEPIAASLGTSMQPVRQALQLVESLALITIRPRFGATVREVTLEDAESTYQARLIIEPALLKLALPSFPGSEYEERARSSLHQMIEAKRAGDLLTARQAHMRFHWALYESADAPWLLHAAQAPFGNAERYRIAASPPWDSAKAHTDLLGACSKGAKNSSQAVKKLREHFNMTLTCVRDQFAGSSAAPNNNNSQSRKSRLRVRIMPPA